MVSYEEHKYRHAGDGSREIAESLFRQSFDQQNAEHAA